MRILSSLTRASSATKLWLWASIILTATGVHVSAFFPFNPIASALTTRPNPPSLSCGVNWIPLFSYNLGSELILLKYIGNNVHLYEDLSLEIPIVYRKEETQFVRWQISQQRWTISYCHEVDSWFLEKLYFFSINAIICFPLNKYLNYIKFFLAWYLKKKKTAIATRTNPIIEKNTALRIMILVVSTLVIKVSFCKS